MREPVWLPIARDGSAQPECAQALLHPLPLRPSQVRCWALRFAALRLLFLGYAWARASGVAAMRCGTVVGVPAPGHPGVP